MYVMLSDYSYSHPFIYFSLLPYPLHAPEHHFPLDSGDCSKHLTKSSITELYPQVDGPLSCGVIFPGPSICEKHLQRLETSENDLTKLVA